MRLHARPGRTLAYQTIPAFPVPADFPIHTCSQCHAESLDESTTAALEKLLAPRYAAELTRRLQAALEVLRRHITLRRLEQLLGLSQGYLSRLKAGAGTPSPALVVQLQQLALDPTARLREIERIWGEPIPS